MAMLAKSMIQQGNFHGDSSPFGLALKRIGETEDQIQGLQEEFVYFYSVYIYFSNGDLGRESETWIIDGSNGFAILNEGLQFIEEKVGE